MAAPGRGTITCHIAPRLRLLPTVCLALLLAALSEAKLDTGMVQLGSMGESIPSWQYIGKFGYGLGAGMFEVKVKSPGAPLNVEVDLELILDEHWSRVQALPPCSPEAREYVKSKYTLSAGPFWSMPAKGGMMQKVRPHIWYFALSTCGKEHNSTNVEFELHTYQTGEGETRTELSVELSYMSSAISLVVLCLSAFLVHFALRCRRFKGTSGRVHPVILVLSLSVLLTWASQVLHLLHLWLYEVAGTSDSGLETSADVLFMLSQVVISTLLIVIANGYSLLSCKQDELKSMKAAAAAIALLHVALVGHSKLIGDHSDKHHENGGMAGWGLLAARLLLWLWFVARVKALQQASFRLEGFLLRFRLAGSSYFLAYPAVFTLARLFAPYLQHPIMYLGLVTMQVGSTIWLSKLFLSRGQFFELSALSDSLLPVSPRGKFGGGKSD